MNITFLGTGCAYPSPTRAASAIILHHSNNGSQWLFDCAEGTQIQIQKIKEVKFKRISKIFITHLHGDHVFGLPGFLSTMAHNETDNIIVDIYGPLGLKKMLRTVIGLSHHDLSFKYCVHEIDVDAKYCPINWSPRIPSYTIDPPLPCEHEGNIITPVHDVDGNITWKLFYDRDCGVTVWAIPLRHTVPSIGFVILSDDRQGRLDVAKAIQLGVPRGPLLGDLKNGHDVVLPSGETVLHSDVVECGRAGTNVAIMGDSCDSESLVALIGRPDVQVGRLRPSIDYLVHEATLQNELEENCLHKGHSTPRMVADIAQRLGVRNLILTHFSQRYLDDGCDSLSNDKETIKILRDEIVDQSLFSGNVFLAKDLMTFELK